MRNVALMNFITFATTPKTGRTKAGGYYTVSTFASAVGLFVPVRRNLSIETAVCVCCAAVGAEGGGDIRRHIHTGCSVILSMTCVAAMKAACDKNRKRSFCCGSPVHHKPSLSEELLVVLRLHRLVSCVPISLSPPIDSTHETTPLATTATPHHTQQHKTALEAHHPNLRQVCRKWPCEGRLRKKGDFRRGQTVRVCLC